MISGVRQAFKPGTGIPGAAKSDRDRDNDSDYRPTGGDHEWTTHRYTVRGVITGGDWSSRRHDPGVVADLRPAEGPASDEREVIERLSKKGDSGESTALWSMPRTTPGVITPPKPKNEFDFGWGS